MQRYWPIRSEEKTKSPEDKMRETEMCDVCGKSYNYIYIKRFDYFSKRGIHRRIGRKIPPLKVV